MDNVLLVLLQKL